MYYCHRYIGIYIIRSKLVNASYWWRPLSTIFQLYRGGQFYCLGVSTIFQLYRGGQFYLWKNFSTLFQLYRGSQSYWWRKPHNISVISWWSATIFQLYRGGQFLLVEETGLNNISAISWRSDLLVEETRVNTISVISWRSVLLVEGNRRTRRKPPTCRKSLTNFIT